MSFLSSLPGWMYTIAYIIFILCTIVMVFVVLLQQGRGGGLADFVSGVGSDLLGVQAKSKIGRFTIILSLVFIGMIFLLNFDRTGSSGSFDTQPEQNQTSNEEPASPLPLENTK